MASDDRIESRSTEDHALLSRRSVLQNAGLVIAAVAFPAEAGTVPGPTVAAQNDSVNGEHPISDVMRRLSTYMSQARDRACPITSGFTTFVGVPAA
jgi:hypothetical protein